MGPHQCGYCERSWEKAQYLAAHLRQKSNYLCKKYALEQHGVTSARTQNANEGTSNERMEMPEIARGADSACETQNSQPTNDFPLPDNEDNMDEDRPESGPPPPNEVPLPAGRVDEDTNEFDEFEEDLIRRAFADYAQDSAQNRAWMEPENLAAVELMHLLNISRAPLSLFDALMKWHTNNMEASKCITRRTLLDDLRARYNMSTTVPYQVSATLPCSEVKVQIPCHDTMQMAMDLLTDPHIEETDYLWHDDDPEAPPPLNWHCLEDINDGLAHRMTHDKLIRPHPFTVAGRKKVLLPLILYMDGCVTGFTENLSLELVKFTFGIFNSKAREKAYTWRVLGAVPKFRASKTAAAKGIELSSHVEAGGYLTPSDSEDETADMRKFIHDYFEFDAHINSEDDEATMCDIDIPAESAQDMHVILRVIMHGWKQIIRQGGFEWDLRHQNSLRLIHFVPFLMFIKGDTVEHGKHCGHYGSRNRGVQSLCRYCVCPANEMDMPYVDHAMKNPALISRLVAKKDELGLQKLSQQLIFNVWYEFMFGLHNQLGVHSACPMEMLHWIQLGVFKYTRMSFFDQIGPDSQLAKEINIIAISMGWLFQRQSDRVYPRTKFTKGVQRGKLMAHEMTGMMLVLLAVVRSSKGRKLLLDEGNNPKQRGNFAGEEAILAWISLLELQLTFEAWLKLPTMDVTTVMRLRTKVREYMQLNKDVARRDSGMGFKINNFHAALHVPDDILNFGPPHVVDTKSNEMMHKPDKGSARRTQKRPKTFDYQSAKQIEDRRVIEIAMQELRGRPRWDYYVGFQRPNQHSLGRIVEREAKRGNKVHQQSLTSPNLTGVSVKYGYTGESFGLLRVDSAMKQKKKFLYPELIVEILHEIKELIAQDLPHIQVNSELDMPNGVKYRASPWFHQKPWYDWALYRFPAVGEGYAEQIRPVHMRCFVDLTMLPGAQGDEYAPGMYFLAETVRLHPSPDEINMSRLFVPYEKLPGIHAPNKTELLEVSRICGPVCVIPDLENENKRVFLAVKGMKDWSNMFKEWVNKPHLVAHEERAMEY